jgi:amino acid permease
LVSLLGGFIGNIPKLCSTTHVDYSRFAYAVLAADELVAVSNTIKFRYDDGKTFLHWAVGENVDNAVWISLFLVIVITINLFPVKVCILAL